MLYFVRHGESEANVKIIFAGQRDNSPLTSKGREQAVNSAKTILLEGILVDEIVFSPLKRARETAIIIAEELGMNLENISSDNRLLEYDMGNLTGTPSGKISSLELITAKNAENPFSFFDRIISFTREFRHKKKNILIVSHGGVRRMLEIIKTKGDPKLFYDIPLVPNAIIEKLDWLE